MADKLRIALVVPHIFMQRDILPEVIFSPGHLALALGESLAKTGHDVTLFSPGPVDTSLPNRTADLQLFENELAIRGDTYLELLKKHPFTFITLARQVQSELVADAYASANNGEFDIVHIYTNEEDIALPYAKLCQKPVVFTHHDPYNFMVKYKDNLPKYKSLNWVSFSIAQRTGMPDDTNWVGNVYHGVSDTALRPVTTPAGGYVVYLGRIIEPKGVHLAIAAVHEYNRATGSNMRLKIAGKHYASSEKKSYWDTRIKPLISDDIEYIGYIGTTDEKQQLLANAEALLVPSLFDEPFGMVAVESLACGTPVIALDSGALPEVIEDGKTGIIVKTVYDKEARDETETAKRLAQAVKAIGDISRTNCRAAYEHRFTAERMAAGYDEIYQRLVRQTTN